jgi:hypothetical protein
MKKKLKPVKASAGMSFGIIPALLEGSKEDRQKAAGAVIPTYALAKEFGFFSKGGSNKKSGSRPSKVRTVMKEFKSGELKSSSGSKVTNPKQAVAIALSEAGLSKNKKSTGGHMASKSKKLFGGKETYSEELSEAKSVKSGKTSPSEFVKGEKSEGHKGEEKNLSKQAKDIKSGKTSPESYAKMEASEPEGKRGGGAIMSSKMSTMGEALRGGGAIMSSKRSTMGAALSTGGEVKGTGVAIKGIRAAKMC